MNYKKYVMADKLEFSEKLVYDYFKQHKLPKSEAEAVIQMVQFARSEETEPSEALKETVNRYLYDIYPNYAKKGDGMVEGRHRDIAGVIFFCCNFCSASEIDKLDRVAPVLARSF